MSDLDTLIEKALDLPEAERTQMALRLLDSVDAPDFHAHLTEEELAAELAKRVHELESGAVKAVPWEEVKETLRREIGR